MKTDLHFVNYEANSRETEMVLMMRFHVSAETVGIVFGYFIVAYAVRPSLRCTRHKQACIHTLYACTIRRIRSKFIINLISRLFSRNSPLCGLWIGFFVAKCLGERDLVLVDRAQCA